MLFCRRIFCSREVESRREALLYTDVTCFGSEWQQLLLVFLPPTHDEDESFTEPSHPLYPEPFNPFLRNKGTAWQIKMEMCRI